MALRKCKECGGQLAKSAAACPHCGAKNPKKAGVLGWLFVLVIVAPIAWQIGTGMSESDRQHVESSHPTQAQAAANNTPQDRWRRTQTEDQMTGAKVTVMSLRSENTTKFEFPYNVRGGSGLELKFRRKTDELDAYLIIDKGQMLCSSLKCSFSLRVGDGEVQRWTGLPTTTHDSDMMFVRDARQLEAIAASGQPIKIGIDFYKAGKRAFDFNTEGYTPP